eukprot:Skav205363  [mRNA]  locus=scaffold3980:63623:65648:+ [translate_table: standard]
MASSSHQSVSMLQPPAQTSSEHHRSIYQLAVDAHAPLPLEYLHLQRLRLLVHILQVQDLHLQGAILLNFAIAGANSWLCAAQKSVVWWASQVGVETLPAALFELHDENSWMELKAQIRPLKKAIRQAQQGHLMRLENLLTLNRHAEQQNEILRDMGWTGPQSSQVVPTELAGHVCATCQATFDTAAALAVHETHKHQKRIAMRRFAPDCVCHGCHRWTYQPLTELHTQTLDQLDRDAKVAHHQRGVKSQAIDRAWRPATTTECAGGLTPLGSSLAMEDADPPEELTAWSLLGLLPPGRGGRDRTQRRLDEVDVPNADARLSLMEGAWKTACRDWRPNFDWVPRPLAEGQKYALCSTQAIADPEISLRGCGGIQSLCPSMSTLRLMPPTGMCLIPLCGSPLSSPARTVKEIAQFCVGNALMVRGLYLLLLVYLHGGAFTLEHPAPREHASTSSSPMPWCIWDSAFIRQMLLAADINLLQFLQGPLGKPYPKPTCLLHARLPGLAAAIFSEYDKTWRPTEKLGGRSAAGEWRTAAAKIYPERMCKALAFQFAWYARQCPVEGSEDDPSALYAALQALSLHWDPYQVGSHEMCGDYHRTAVPNSFVP